MRTACSVSILKTRIEPTEATGIYYLIFDEYEFESFSATSGQIRLMAFYLKPEVIGVSLES